jgi:hypothetical protein
MRSRASFSAGSCSGPRRHRQHTGTCRRVDRSPFDQHRGRRNEFTRFAKLLLFTACRSRQIGRPYSASTAPDGFNLCRGESPLVIAANSEDLTAMAVQLRKIFLACNLTTAATGSGARDSALAYFVVNHSFLGARRLLYDPLPTTRCACDRCPLVDLKIGCVCSRAAKKFVDIRASVARRMNTDVNKFISQRHAGSFFD